MKKTLFYLSTLWMVFFLQLLLDRFLGGSIFSCSIILVAVLYFGLIRGPLTGLVLGFFWGLFADAATMGLLGLSAFLYSAAGYCAGMLRRQLDETKPWTQAIFSLGVSFLYVVCSVVLERIFSPDIRPVSWIFFFTAHPERHAGTPRLPYFGDMVQRLGYACGFERVKQCEWYPAFPNNPPAPAAVVGSLHSA